MEIVSENIPEKLRYKILVRDGFACTRCKRSKEEDNAKLIIHHIIFRTEGGTHAEENLTTLCVECHKDIHRDRDKKKCTVSLELPWEMYDVLSPVALAQKTTFRQFLMKELPKYTQQLAKTK